MWIFKAHKIYDYEKTQGGSSDPMGMLGVTVKHWKDLFILNISLKFWNMD